MLFNEDADIAHFDLLNSRTYPMKFKHFQAPALFLSTFKALNLGEKNSSTFKDFQGCVGTLHIFLYRETNTTQNGFIKPKKHDIQTTSKEITDNKTVSRWKVCNTQTANDKHNFMYQTNKQQYRKQCFSKESLSL